MVRTKNIIANFRKKRILVIGDIILDQHIRGTISRISPEAPVPVVLQEKDPTFAPGGAANVATNLIHLKARVTLVGRIGPDSEGKTLLKELAKRKVPRKGIFVDPATPTIVKTRIVAHHQQVLRLDREKVNHLCEGKVLDRILAFIRANIREFDAIIISDYGKGMISQRLITEVCSLALSRKIVVTVDPKVEHFAYYRRVTCITPNRSETENAIRNIKITQHDTRALDINSDRLLSHSDVERAGMQLLKYLDLDSLLVTLGEQGMCLFEKGNPPFHIHTRAKEVFDVTGAGDTVISVFTLSLTAGATKREAAELANAAAGIVVGKVGVATVAPEELLGAAGQGR